MTLRAGAGPDVHVSTTRHWSLREPHAGHRVDNGVLTITGSCPWVGLGRHISEEVTIPSGTAARVTTSAGGVEATDLDVSAFDAHASAGSITASFVNPPSEIRAQTSAGNVQLRMPSGSDHVDADTSAGDIQVGLVQTPARSARSTRPPRQPTSRSTPLTDIQVCARMRSPGTHPDPEYTDPGSSES